MSLSRFINQQTLLSINNPQYGQLWTDKDLSILDEVVLIPSDPNIVKDQRSEIHIYSFYGDQLVSNHNSVQMIYEKSVNSLLIDVRTTFKEAGIDRGSYLIVVNLFQDVWGEFGNEKVILKEMSPDRTELKFSIDKKFIGEFAQFQNDIQYLSQNDILNNLVVNFGYNNVQKVIGVWFDGDGQHFYVKLYQPVSDAVDVKDKAWFQFEVIDPYVDTVVLSQPTIPANIFNIGGPNFTLDTTQYQSNATTYKSWDDVLDANLSTRQRIIEQSLSGSDNVVLNTDFTDFSNYIFYSSAEERLRNFHYKVGKIEEYSASKALLFNSTASNTDYVSGSIGLNERRIDQITSNFDPWERWLYYESTASIFTHEISGSVTPWPKRIISGSWTPYSVSSSIVQSWYSNLLVSASEYDVYNNNRLYWSIPEHIYMDPANSDFVTFVDMVGEHFDVLYTYITALTKIHERDEHPQRGAPNGLLFYIAKSFGWNLQNTRQLADLWDYKLGTDSSGSHASTGSMFSLTHENQTHQIWRRIVNNLPFLLKTKGTMRSVKALLSIYGIPQTLISIKEYGGPAKKVDNPVWIDDRFKYEATFTGSNYVELNRRIIHSTSGSWDGHSRVPDVVEFAFRTNYTSSVSMSLWAIENAATRSLALANLQLVHKRYLDGTSSYQGSEDYGQLKMEIVRVNSSHVPTGAPIISYTDYAPFFNGDNWTVKISTNYFDFSSSAFPYPLQIISVTASRAGDFSSGRIIDSASLSVEASSGATNFAFSWGAHSGSANNPHTIVLGGTTGSRSITGSPSSSRFVGQISGYKEYFTSLNDPTHTSHVLNPAAYHDNTSTGSFSTLFRYYPLGIDQQRWDHHVYTQVSSSHPNRLASFDTTASFRNWTGSQADQYESYNETYFINTPTLGGNLLRSQKIRFEDAVLARDLSPNSRTEVGAYDRAGFDTNRLAIVFAPSDHVNFDIFNHAGFSELDDYIGDPQYEFESEYSELNRFSGQYFKKYVNSYDVNSLIKVLSLYDYTFFEQVKQLIPAKADALLGILIESDVLHRSKVQLTKRPSIENLGYDADIPRYQMSASGENPQFEGSASNLIVLDWKYQYVTGTFSPAIIATGSSLSHLNSGSRDALGGIVDVFPNRYSGSQCPTMSYVDGTRTNCCYQKVTYHYSSSGIFINEYEKQWYTAVSMSYGMYYSRSLECTSYQWLEGCSVENRSRFAGSKLEGADFNINSTNTIDGGPVISIWESNPNSLRAGDSPLGGQLYVE